MTSLTILGLMIGLVFVQGLIQHREHDKRINDLERKFSRRTEENHQESDGRT